MGTSPLHAFHHTVWLEIPLSSRRGFQVLPVRLQKSSRWPHNHESFRISCDKQFHWIGTRVLPLVRSMVSKRYSDRKSLRLHVLDESEHNKTPWINHRTASNFLPNHSASGSSVHHSISKAFRGDDTVNRKVVLGNVTQTENSHGHQTHKRRLGFHHWHNASRTSSN